MKNRIKLDPTQVLVLGFLGLILLGSLLLTLPAASADGNSAPYLDSVFTATSAVCVTGLVVRDTATEWSTFGHIVIISLIQIGGLGFMTMATVILIIMGRKIRLRDRLIIQEALNEFSLKGLVALIQKIVVLTLAIEIFGAAILSTRFIPQFGFVKGLSYSLFHSISAFCNAGFDLMGSSYGPYSSFTAYTSDAVVNITLIVLIVVGGLGFTVLLDIAREKRFSKLSLHSKVVLFITGFLLAAGFLFFLLVEYNNPETLGSLNFRSKVLASFFQSVTTRTAGFNTISQDGLSNPGKLMTIILMFIGASPAGTGGGIKTTTFAVIILMIITVIKGNKEITLYDRRVSRTTAYKALAISMIAFAIVIIFTMVLSIAEQGNASGLASFENILYEATSAFATVGLSSGITPSISPVSKVFMIITMFIGRVGPLTLTLAFANRARNTNIKYSFPEGKIMVG
ncbi:MAG: Trk family potassium uptake protein [Clostridia bacterium]|nr:Trk family potassium uptake protein [Clostridia bacterium]